MRTISPEFTHKLSALKNVYLEGNWHVICRIVNFSAVEADPLLVHQLIIACTCFALVVIK